MTGTCPECLRDVMLIGPSWNRQGRTVSEDGRTVQEVFSGWECPSCHATIFRAELAAAGTNAAAQPGHGRPIGHWPIPGVSPPHPTYPAPVAADWREAHIAIGVGLLKSVAAMSRRAVQGICIDKQASPKKVLRDQIDELGTSQALHRNLVQWAHQIRLFGNVGAHPGDDGLEDITEDEARQVVAFLDELLRYVYELPDRLSKLQAGTTP